MIRWKWDQHTWEEYESKWDSATGSRSGDPWVSFIVVGIGSESRSEISCKFISKQVRIQ
jgi:hypothetical protein